MSSMPISCTHTMRQSFRRLIAVMLTTIYLLIVISPLASLAMQSKTVSHAVTGECAGDCRICGCSPAASANQTCCCAMKKQKPAKLVGLASDPCSTIKSPAVEQKKDCCSKPAPQPPKQTASSCCVKKTLQQDDDHEKGPQQDSDPSGNETVYKCGCPCDKGKLFAINVIGSNELLPISPSERIELHHTGTLYTDHAHRLISRHGDPPDPPPRLLPIS